MRQLPLTQVIHAWVKDEYVTRVKQCKIRRGLLYDAIIDDLKALRDALKNGSVTKNGRVMSSYLQQRHVDYIQLIIDRLPELLYAKPSEFLSKHIPDFEKLVSRQIVNDKIRINGDTPESLSDRLVRIMRYMTVRKKIAPEFFRKLEVKSCVYCNANYAITDAQNEAYFDMDHWKPKALYPYLSISFFNFQPSCAYCNRRKNDSDEPFFGLWNEQMGANMDVLDFKLSDYSLIKYIVFGDKKDLNVTLEPVHPHDPQNVKLRDVAEQKFHLEARYKEHDDVVEEIVWKKWIYNQSYVLSLRRALGYEIPSFVDVRRFILGTYADAEDIHKRPLTRMIQAVAKKVGVL